MNTPDMKEFRIGDLFDVSGTKSIDVGKIGFVKKGVNFVGRGVENNGIQGKIIEQSYPPNEAFTLTASVVGQKRCFYQEEPYYCSQNINKLTPIFDRKLDRELGLYFATLIQKFLNQFSDSWGGYKLDDLKNYQFELPITPDGNPDWEYMSRYIAELEAQHIAELEAYLQATGLDDYELTDEDIKTLSLYENWVKKNRGDEVADGTWKEMREYKVGELFDINTTAGKFNAKDVAIYEFQIEDSFPYVVRTANNNGLKGYIKADMTQLNPKNTISFAQDTAEIFYQQEKYFTGDKMKVFSLKNYILNEKISNYLISALKKGFSNFSWGSSQFNVDTLKGVNIILPINLNNEIDFKFMEDYITAVQKLVIKDVVKFAEDEHAALEKIVGE